MLNTKGKPCQGKLHNKNIAHIPLHILKNNYNKIQPGESAQHLLTLNLSVPHHAKKFYFSYKHTCKWIMTVVAMLVKGKKHWNQNKNIVMISCKIFKCPGKLTDHLASAKKTEDFYELTRSIPKEMEKGMIASSLESMVSTHFGQRTLKYSMLSAKYYLLEKPSSVCA